MARLSQNRQKQKSAADIQKQLDDFASQVGPEKVNVTEEFAVKSSEAMQNITVNSDCLIKEIANFFGVEIEAVQAGFEQADGKTAETDKLIFKGEVRRVADAKKFMERLAEEELLEKGISPEELDGQFASFYANRELDGESLDFFSNVQDLQYMLRVESKNDEQAEYMRLIKKQTPYTIAIGRAGTGKTHLAVACGIKAVMDKKYDTLLICRPVVEAGEHLGYLPGDSRDKLAPYTAVCFIKLEDLVAPTTLKDLKDRGKIKVIPLAFMRGHTFNNTFVILDEAQNATPEQAEMFVTRLGRESQSVICGDNTQSDLVKNWSRKSRGNKKIETGLDFLLEVTGQNGGEHFKGKDNLRRRMRNICGVVELRTVLRSAAAGVMLDGIEALKEHRENKNKVANKEDYSIYVGSFVESEESSKPISLKNVSIRRGSDAGVVVVDATGLKN